MREQDEYEKRSEREFLTGNMLRDDGEEEGERWADVEKD
jgi:hypothetical protein